MLMFDVLEQLELLNKVKSVDTRGRGIINRSYIVDTIDGRYVLQLVDFNIFENTYDVIYNLDLLGEYFKKLGLFNPNTIYNKNGKPYILVKGSFWSCYKLTEDEDLIKVIDNNHIIYELASILGRFHKITKDFDASNLKVTLPNYLDQYNYFLEFEKVYKNSKSDKTLYTYNEYKFIDERKDSLKLIKSLLDNKTLPLRTTHNNVRKSNVIFDGNLKARILIGNDALMPGSLVNDFGELGRYAFSSQKEGEHKLDTVFFDRNRVVEGVKGYLEAAKEILTEEEVKYLLDGIKIKALENGIRHLTEYLKDEGDYNPYFVDYDLTVARNQFKLVTEIEENDELIRSYILQTWEGIKKSK